VYGEMNSILRVGSLRVRSQVPAFKTIIDFGKLLFVGRRKGVLLTGLVGSCTKKRINRHARMH